MRRILSVFTLVTCLAAAAAVPARAAVTSAPPGRTRPDATRPFGVGLTTFTAADPARPGRTLTMDVWYPTSPAAASGSPASLDLLVRQLGLPGVRRDAEPARGEQFPLVAFSHGSGAIRFQSWFLLEALAAHGYVVVAPDHAGNTALDPLFGTVDPIPLVLENRPRDMSFAVDVALARSADRTDLLAGTVDGSRIGVVGHSYGGFTALATAGGYHGRGPDEGVDAVMAMDATDGLLTVTELAAADVPTLLLNSTSFGPGIMPLGLREISASPSWQVDIHRAGHQSFTNICDILEALRDAALPPTLWDFLVSAADDGCAPRLLPIEEAHRITVQYALAFLRTTIGHDARWRHLLSPQYAERNGLPVTVDVRTGHRRAA